MCEECNNELEGCYCDEEQGGGYSYSDEYGVCDVCCAKYNPYNESKWELSETSVE